MAPLTRDEVSKLLSELRLAENTAQYLDGMGGTREKADREQERVLNIIMDLGVRKD